MGSVSLPLPKVAMNLLYIVQNSIALGLPEMLYRHEYFDPKDFKVGEYCAQKILLSTAWWIMLLTVPSSEYMYKVCCLIFALAPHHRSRFCKA